MALFFIAQNNISLAAPAHKASQVFAHQYIQSALSLWALISAQEIAQS
jgi:hypothetical protein